MINITVVFIGIIVLFAFLLALRAFSSLKICALCGSVTISWIFLLMLFYSDVRIEPLLIALLVGGTSVGLTNKLADKLPKKYSVFKLPFYLLFLFLAYLAITQKFVLEGAVVVLVLWLIIIALFFFRKSDQFNSLAKKIIECCKNW